jgi:hypothetical protein
VCVHGWLAGSKRMKVACVDEKGVVDQGSLRIHHTTPHIIFPNSMNPTKDHHPTTLSRFVQGLVAASSKISEQEALYHARLVPITDRLVGMAFPEPVDAVARLLASRYQVCGDIWSVGLWGCRRDRGVCMCVYCFGEKNKSLCVCLDVYDFRRAAWRKARSPSLSFRAALFPPD